MKKIVLLLSISLSLSGLIFAQEDLEPEIEYDQKTEQTTESATVEETPDSVWAEIKFDKLTHDYGKIAFGADGSCEFKFTNNGTGQLILNNVKSTCGCTVPDWPKQPIAPGESETIKVVYNTNRSGAFTKGITVYSNATENTIRLLIKGEVAVQDDKPTLGK